MKFTILGSGFGIYGYLPALVLNDCEIILQSRYKEKIKQREELKYYSNKITWVETEEEAIEISSGIVVAKRPFEQVQIVRKILRYENIKYIFLEKPLAPTPEESYDIQEKIIESNKVFGVGYIFRYTSWGKSLGNIVNSNDVDLINIEWSFMAHHFKNHLNNWKRYDSAGGGILRFYGIQLIALIAELGYEDVGNIKIIGDECDQSEIFCLSFYKKNSPEINVTINSKSTYNVFIIESIRNEEKKEIFLNESPFDEFNKNKDSDIRVNYLREHISTAFKENIYGYDSYRRTIQLWSRIENLISSL
ncbi:MAG: Gfo/Idh/MocA family oxidoreductase [Clostridium beijerinckii]|jgi:hypothetical protein|uniref:Gfo/Idh/MocA family oxidoreductase n=1 Tax=Clostridium beijerinckii TaxID=1520 RepID=UPI001F4C3055|nr:Gfo/Idh/MocA family oxidoreductase [Clostridium beijerinckii]MCI1477721.1 Gfo/Idh/MocA family oxidoreductase [Clostridium beijerinckii]MCI1577963.1 Gfo/Idh/MocA family oxidoreductase [Clostridium beijerinckii]MCI1583144.1 Gfo/Idh/MocA family oxidoreductase [Clostridium beijerinckii]MCI1620626.1 Gfo/Idh/MocA family oxidoreductase [Clostridium beijerinckii]